MPLRHWEMPAGFWYLIFSIGPSKYTRRVYTNPTGPAVRPVYLEHLSTPDRATPTSTLYATLITLSIHSPQNPHIRLPAFIARFPGLENLTLEPSLEEVWYNMHDYPTSPPPLRGYLWCNGISQFDTFTRALTYGLQMERIFGR